jgi:hypothetical protein
LGAILLVLMALAAVGSWAAKFQWRALVGGDRDLWLLTAVIGGLLAAMALSPVTAVVGFVGVEVITSYVLTVAATRAHLTFPDSARNLLWSTFSAVMGIAMALVDLAFGLVWQRHGLLVALAGTVAAQLALCGAVALAVRLSRRDGSQVNVEHLEGNGVGHAEAAADSGVDGVEPAVGLEAGPAQTHVVDPVHP